MVVIKHMPHHLVRIKGGLNEGEELGVCHVFGEGRVGGERGLCCLFVLGRMAGYCHFVFLCVCVRVEGGL